MTIEDAKKGIFHIKNPYKDPARRVGFSLVASALEGLLGLRELNYIYAEIMKHYDGKSFANDVLHYFGVSYEVSEQDVARIPEKGPVVVVANHPFGAIEGVLLLSLLKSIRPDVRVLANYMLNYIPEMRQDFIAVDPFGGQDASRKNMRPMKEALHWLRQGGLLAVFPAGEVAHYEWGKRGVIEGEWNQTVAGLIRHTQTPVLPIFFEGSNPVSFNLAGLINPRLRTILLPRQLLNKMDHKFHIQVGSLIPYRKLEKTGDMMPYLRMRTLNLGHREEKKNSFRILRLPRRGSLLPQKSEQVIPPVPVQELVHDIGSLPVEQRLLQSAELDVWYARAEQMPSIMREIGRLREITFRAVGEGTGRSIDLDEYDAYYVHLFLWNRSTNEIVAAYRVGPTDEILSRWGKTGLYTNSLFKYQKQLLEQINPALEMGRTFVREAYQKNFTSLYLLWKGIGHYLVRNPRYRILFGPVSISGNYKTSSRDLLVAFLKMNNYKPDLAKMVKARTPLKQKGIRALLSKEYRSVVSSLDEVEDLISDIENELHGIPILLRQYLRLGGKLLGFNVDPAFSYVLDGLILVDLTETDSKMLAHYMGAEGVKEYLRHHGVSPGKGRSERF